MKIIKGFEMAVDRDSTIVKSSGNMQKVIREHIGLVNLIMMK